MKRYAFSWKIYCFFFVYVFKAFCMLACSHDIIFEISWITLNFSSLIYFSFVILFKRHRKIFNDVISDFLLLKYCNYRYCNDNKLMSTSDFQKFLQILICACQHADTQNFSISDKCLRKNIVLENDFFPHFWNSRQYACLHAGMHKHRKYQTRNWTVWNL